jgi:8-oxo-dGTP diphosphatase
MADLPRPAIAAAIIVADGRVLLVRRRRSEGSLSWQFPAGEVEPGETAEQAAVRETHEEVDLIVTATAVLGQRIHPNTGRTLVYVACDVLAGVPQIADDAELDASEWCDRAQLREHVPHGLYPPVQEYIDSLVA